MKRKILALLLVLTVAISIAPLAAYAECEGGCNFWELSMEYGHQKSCLICGEDEIPLEDHYDDDGDGFCDVDFCHYDIAKIHDHEPGDDCKCTICGQPYHTGYTVVKTETTHKKMCTDCGEVFYEGDHVITDDGFCIDCGFNCKHEKQDHVAIDQYGHQAICSKCGTALDVEDHTFADDGSCTVCDYVPCDGAHTFGNFGYRKHVCRKCSFTTPCEDADGDCVCDICGQECHDIASVTWNETRHWYTCSVCGKDAYKSKHFDFNNDGVCDGCKCSMSDPGSGTTNFNEGEAPVIPNAPEAPAANPNGLDNVPKTGDVTIPFLAAAVLLVAGAAVVLPLRKRVF